MEMWKAFEKCKEQNTSLKADIKEAMDQKEKTVMENCYLTILLDAKLEKKENQLDAARKATKKEQEQVSAEKTKWREMQKHHFNQAELVKNKMKEEKKKNVKSINAMTDLMFGALDEVASNRKITKTAAKKSISAQEVAAALLEKLR
eukprot:13453518-Ditylum_brightwellii.AAC.2